MEVDPCECPECGCETLTHNTILCEQCTIGQHVPCHPDCLENSPHIDAGGNVMDKYNP